MKRINARADGRFKRDPEPNAKKGGDRPSDVAREPRPSCLDLARRAGFIGAYKDAPADLSTNPRRMEGFGRD